LNAEIREQLGSFGSEAAKERDRVGIVFMGEEIETVIKIEKNQLGRDQKAV